MIERRRYRRCILKGVARIVVPGRAAEIKGVLEDMSVGGIGLYTTEALPKDELITMDVEVRTPRGEMIRDRMVGRVAWTRDWGGFILHGIAFDDEVDKDNHPSLFPFLTDLGCA